MIETIVVGCRGVWVREFGGSLSGLLVGRHTIGVKSVEVAQRGTKQRVGLGCV